MEETTNQPPEQADTSASDSESSTRPNSVGRRILGCLKSAWNSKVGKFLRLGVIPLCFYFADIGTDVGLAVQFFRSGDITWFALTLVFVILPSIVENFAIFWYRLWRQFIQSNHCAVDKVGTVVCALQLGVIAIYCYACRDILKNGQWNGQPLIDISSMYEVILESLPQLCLQLYIIISTGRQPNVTQILGIVTSLVAAVKAVVMMWYNEQNYSGLRMKIIFGFLFTAWKSVELSARVLAIALLATVIKAWILLLIGGNWLLMTIVYLCLNPNYTRSKILVTCIEKAVETFTVTISFGDRRMFWVNTVVTLLGNITMVTVWYTYMGQQWYDIPALVGVVVGSVVSAGITILLRNLGFIKEIRFSKHLKRPSSSSASSQM
ncbi:XK-related protein 8-like [Branchiostoma floridae x Branchiostoma belcheri]